MVRGWREALPEAEGTTLVQPGDEKGSGAPNSSLLTPNGEVTEKAGPGSLLRGAAGFIEPGSGAKVVEVSAL